MTREELRVVVDYLDAKAEYVIERRKVPMDCTSWGLQEAESKWRKAEERLTSIDLRK